MKIGLIDADMMWGGRGRQVRYGHTRASIFPNLVMMKLSAYHRQQGDEVEWYNAMSGWYDRVYISKVFSKTPSSAEVIQADEVYYGGTGYCVSLENGVEVYKEPKDDHYLSALPPEIEHTFPDYSLYPENKDTAYGFLSRGCPRGCSFCHVAAKEGRKAYKVAELKEWWNGQKNICLCDPNLLACKDWRDLLTQLAESGAWVDVNQGMDARLITPEKMEYLNKMKLSTIHFAWDDYKQKDAVLKGLQCFADNYKRKFVAGHTAQVFVLTNYDTTPEQDLERIYLLRDMGFEPYVMVYDKPHASQFYRSLQRWVNMRPIFHKIKTFEEYDKTKARE